MKTIDFKEMGVRELESTVAASTDGGAFLILPSAWINVIVTYVKYTMETGGQYVTYHAQ